MRGILNNAFMAICLTVAAVGALVVLQGPTVSLASEHQEPALSGTWLQTLTFPDAPSFQTLDSYTADGVFVETASIDLTPATLSGPTHGAWIRTGDHSYRCTARAFSFDPQGNPSGTYIINQSLTIDDKGDRYSGSGSVEIIFNGVVTFSDTFTTVATRIKVD
jgi:hypothetical protein